MANIDTLEDLQNSSLGIRLPNETDLSMKSLLIVIAGWPGAGKTALACTADKPLVINADGERAQVRARTRIPQIKVDNWLQASGITNPRMSGELEAFNTIVIDTAGALIEKLITHILANKDSYYKCVQSNGNNLTFIGWGVVRRTMINFINYIRFVLKKDLVICSQVREDDNKKIVLEIAGGTQATITQNADFVGRLYNSGNQFILDFNRTEYFDGKNFVGLPPQRVPLARNSPYFLADIITQMRDKAKADFKEQVQQDAYIAGLKQQIEQANDAQGLNEWIKRANNIDNNDTKAIIKRIIFDFSKSLASVRFNKEKLVYEIVN